MLEDLATVDLISGGRAEITAGRSAYSESSTLFGSHGALFAGSPQEVTDKILWEHELLGPLLDLPDGLRRRGRGGG